MPLADLPAVLAPVPEGDVLSWVDRAVAVRVEQVEHCLGVPAGCRAGAGCNDCCKLSTWVLAWEERRVGDASHAADVALGGAVRARVEQEAGRFAQAQDGALLRACVEAADAGGGESKALGPEWRYGYRAVGIMCPLLDPSSGGCSIYADRPLACRVHWQLEREGVCDQPGAPEAGRLPAVQTLDLYDLGNWFATRTPEKRAMPLLVFLARLFGVPMRLPAVAMEGDAGA